MAVVSQRRARAGTDAAWEELLAAVRREVASSVERTVEHMRRNPAYAQLDPGAQRVVVRRNFDAVLSGMERRRPPTEDDAHVFDEQGGVRARQQIPVADMLAAWRVGLKSLHRLAREVAPDVPERDALLLEYLELAMAWADFGMLAAADGHRRTELTLAREQHHAVANLLRRLMEGAAAPAEVRSALAPLGLDPDLPYHAVIARPDPSAGVEEIERYLGVELASRGHGLAALIDGHVCGFVVSLPKAPAPTAVGVSEAVALTKLEPAFQRARRSMETALVLGAKGIFDLAELGLDAAVGSDPDVGDVMVRRYIDALEAAQGGDVILHTADRYLANDLSVEQTARDIGVHVNTVRQRLNRFEAVTGRSLRETETIVEVWWALERKRLG